MPLDAERLAAIDDTLLQSIIVMLFRPGTINLQKYLADQGGYPYWHSELYPSPQPDHGDSLHRVVLWTNDLSQRRLRRRRDGISLPAAENRSQDRRVINRSDRLYAYAQGQHAKTRR